MPFSLLFRIEYLDENDLLMHTRFDDRRVETLKPEQIAYLHMEIHKSRKKVTEPEPPPGVKKPNSHKVVLVSHTWCD